MKTTLKTAAICALVIAAFCFGKAVAEFPELNAAKRNLVEGRTHLNNAARDFGGHRAKAVEALDRAIKEIDEAILYGDKK
jgi:hypothetical protein